MKVLLCLLAAVSLSMGNLLGATNCPRGPSYWCANIPQAKECFAMKHCIKAVWEKRIVPEDHDDVCTICKDMVAEARDTLMSNETQEELKEVFDGSCDLIPISIIATECKKLADEFIPELVETLASEMNPVEVCTVAGLCNSARIDRLLAEQATGGDCNICREGATRTMNQLKTMDRNKAEDKLLEMCGYAGTFSDACMVTVLDEFKTMYTWLTQSFNAEICDLSGLCSEAFDNVPATQLQAGADIQCEFCEKVVKHWVDVYLSNSSLAEFKTVMEALCDRLDKKNSAHCKHIVDAYYIPAFKFLKNEINPHTVCSLVGLCGPGGFMQVGPETPIVSLLSSKKHNVVEMIPLQPAIKVTGRDELSSNLVHRVPLTRDPAALNGALYAPSTIGGMEKPTCVLCEYVLHELQQFLTEGQTEEEIKEEVNKICEFMPSSVRAKCHLFINTYEPAIVELLAREIREAQICTMLRLCDQEVLENTGPQGSVIVEKSSSCEMCEFALNEVFSVLRDHDNQRMVKNVLESICYRLPNSIERSCENFVEKYTATIINMIVNGLSPDEICRAIDLCREVRPPPKGTGCVLCEYVISTLDNMIEDKSNVEEIKAALESLCSYLPSSISKECNAFIENYTSLIIDYLTKGLDPDEICTELGICREVGNVIEQEVGPPLKDTGCVLCEYVITTLDGMLEDKTNVAEIKAALESLCSYLPSTISKECNAFIETYTDVIIDYLTKGISPEQICTEIGLCKGVGNVIEHEVILQHEIVFDQSSTSPYCTLCEYAIQQLDAMLEDKQNEEEIKKTLDVLCQSLSLPIKKQCLKLVDQYTEEIIDLFVKEYTPEMICSELSLCVDNQISSNAIPDLEDELETQELDLPFQGASKVSCVMCEFAMKILDEHLEDEATIDQVERTVQFLCSYLPGTIADKCEDFVDKFGERVIRIIVDNEMDPEQVCKELQLCSAIQLPELSLPVAVGGKRCAWGPTYWCQSPFHAKVCGATQHCLETVWSQLE